jgi:capsid protein
MAVKRTQKPKRAPFRPVHESGYYSAVGYRSARVMRDVDGTTPTMAGGNLHEVVSRDRIIAQSREFRRDNLLYSGLMERCIDFAIGHGFALTAQDKTVDALWDEWLAVAEVTGRYNGRKFARAVAREFLTTGEGVLLKVNGGQVQLIESEQIVGRAANDMGIVLDEYGRPVKYKVAPYNNGVIGTAVDISARDVVFLCEYERPSSVRGMPVLQTAFPMLHRINDVLDSEVLAWQVLSRVVLKHTSESGTGFGGATEGTQGSDGVNVSEMPYALIFHGGEGDDLASMDRNIPGKDFPASLTTFCRLLGLPLGIPLELVLLDWTQSNFSQMRGALLLAYRRFRELQDLFIQDLYEPLFRWKFNQWVTMGLIEDTPETRQHYWVTPQFPWIDPLAEAQAQEKLISIGLTTHAEACKTLEHDREAVIAKMKLEVIEAINIAKDVEAQTGVLPPWEQFAGRSVGKTEQAARVEAGTDETEPTNET